MDSELRGIPPEAEATLRGILKGFGDQLADVAHSMRGFEIRLESTESDVGKIRRHMFGSKPPGAPPGPGEPSIVRRMATSEHDLDELASTVEKALLSETKRQTPMISTLLRKANRDFVLRALTLIAAIFAAYGTARNELREPARAASQAAADARPLPPPAAVR